MSIIIEKTEQYLPHTLETRLDAVKTFRSGFSVKFVVRRYKISKASLMRRIHIFATIVHLNGINGKTHSFF